MKLMKTNLSRSLYFLTLGLLLIGFGHAASSTQAAPSLLAQGSQTVPCDANELTVVISVSTPGDTLILPENCTFELNAPIIITHDLTLLGNNATLLGDGTFRILSIGSDAIVSIDALTIAYGVASDNDGGGGIYNQGEVTLTNSTFHDNWASSGLYGGALFNDAGSVTIENAQFFQNSILPNGYGGAIANRDGTLNISRSTFYENSAGSGGAIYNLSGVTKIDSSTLRTNTSMVGGAILHNAGAMAVSNSLLSENSASQRGGAISSHNTLTISNSTIERNDSPLSGAIENGSGNLTIVQSTFSENTAQSISGISSYGTTNAPSTLTLINSILADDHTTLDCSSGNWNTLTLRGTNLIRDGSCMSADADVLTGDPMFDVLNENGGPTGTLYLLPGSAAIDAGEDSEVPPDLTTDQRGAGHPRILGSHVDLGAFESLPSATPTGPSSNTPTRTPTRTPSLTPTFTPSNTSTFTPTQSGTPPSTKTPTPTFTPSNTRTTTPTFTPTYSPTPLDCPAFPISVANSDVAGLILAIRCANAAATDDTINLATNGTYLLTAAIAPGSSGLPVIANKGKLTINGNGSTIARSSAGGTALFGLFYVDYSAKLALSNIILSNGQLSGAIGSAINNQFGTVSLVNSTVSGNVGGAIDNYNGTMTISNTIFKNNTTNVTGGAIANLYGSTMSLTNVTFSGNTGFNGGAIENTAATLSIANSTFSSNIANSKGGAIANYSDYYGTQIGTVTLVNTTLSNNTANSGHGGAIYNEAVMSLVNSTVTGNHTKTGYLGGGIYAKSGTLTLKNSIVANSSVGKDCDRYGSLTIYGSGTNLVETSNCGTLAGTNVVLTGNPNLGPLADNGGPTFTHLLLPGSIAIDAGDDSQVPANVTTDQRGAGYPRIVGSHVDLGAFESSGVATATVTASATFDGSPSATFTPTYTFTPTSTRTPTPRPTNTAPPDCGGPGADGGGDCPDPATATPTYTRTFTPTNTKTFTPTFTRTFTPTFTPTFTATVTGTIPTATPSYTFTPTFTPSNTATFTPTMTGTIPTSTSSFTPSKTFTPTSTRTAMPTNTAPPDCGGPGADGGDGDCPTAAPTNTATFTRTFTPTNTKTPTPTFTRTFTPTFTKTATGTATSTNTATFTKTFTPTFTATYTMYQARRRHRPTLSRQHSR